MKKILIVTFVIGLAGLLWVLLSRSPGNHATGTKPSTIAASDAAASPFFKAVQSLTGSYPRWEGGRATDLHDPRWKVFLDRSKADRAWQGKMPIDFFGKVIDLEGHPIGGATINFVWTDLSATGSSQSTTKSDVDGLFSLRGARGKNLGVEVTKEGYNKPKQDRYGFEYASFSDEEFYQPNPATPVIFRLRKKQPAAPLIYQKQELKISIGATSEVTLDTGTKLQIDLIANPRSGQGLWSMRVSVLNGGLQPTAEEFPFSAPLYKYQASLVLDDNTPKPPTWESLYQGGSFYLKAGSNYGRIEVQMISGKDWMRIKSWINPSGSQNLEFAPPERE